MRVFLSEHFCDEIPLALTRSSLDSLCKELKLKAICSSIHNGDFEKAIDLVMALPEQSANEIGQSLFFHLKSVGKPNLGEELSRSLENTSILWSLRIVRDLIKQGDFGNAEQKISKSLLRSINEDERAFFVIEQCLVLYQNDSITKALQGFQKLSSADSIVLLKMKIEKSRIYAANMKYAKSAEQAELAYNLAKKNNLQLPSLFAGALLFSSRFQLTKSVEAYQGLQKITDRFFEYGMINTYSEFSLELIRMDLLNAKQNPIMFDPGLTIGKIVRLSVIAISIFRYDLVAALFCELSLVYAVKNEIEKAWYFRYLSLHLAGRHCTQHVKSRILLQLKGIHPKKSEVITSHPSESWTLIKKKFNKTISNSAKSICGQLSISELESRKAAIDLIAFSNIPLSRIQINSLVLAKNPVLSNLNGDLFNSGLMKKRNDRYEFVDQNYQEISKEILNPF